MKKEEKKKNGTMNFSIYKLVRINIFCFNKSKRIFRPGSRLLFYPVGFILGLGVRLRVSIGSGARRIRP